MGSIDASTFIGIDAAGLRYFRQGLLRIEPQHPAPNLQRWWGRLAAVVADGIDRREGRAGDPRAVVDTADLGDDQLYIPLYLHKLRDLFAEQGQADTAEAANRVVLAVAEDRDRRRLELRDMQDPFGP
jgi:hypothetical protein